MVEESQEEKKQEGIVETEEIKDVTYHKDFVTFVVKPIRIEQVERWAKWCADRGLNTRKNQPKAFALAMDILEGKTQDIVNSGKHIQDIEKLLEVLDSRITKIEEALSQQPEEMDANEKARERVRKKKEKREQAKKEEEESDESE